MLRPLFAIALLLALPGLAAERASKARVSANGLYSVRLVEDAPGQCRVEMLKESGLAWQFSGCVGTVNDLYFASNDGERFWVLHPLAEKGTKGLVLKQGKRKVRIPGWANTPVAALYDRAGQKLQEKRLPDFLKSKELSEVRQMQGHFKWLEGTLGIPGKGPRLTDQEKVEFEAVGGKFYSLSF
ncbi:hypothetical protein [Hyalangium rubrum]|uniref:Lipoprotein n=1 Tax=Hyalangium rubrum TaxID=3103134 RepID=A0ABU5HGH3_9BACT|nr:hypothetical protein [Hyalangium sp. s54d21]MDY7232365.1 hypothetical protein [Hyalangium sp. s54d21]